MLDEWRYHGLCSGPAEVLCPEVIIHAAPISLSPPPRTLGPAPRLMAHTFHAPPRARRSTGLWPAEYLDTVVATYIRHW